MCSDKPLDEMIIQEITDKLSDPNSTWLQGIEETVKLAIEANITSMLTCEMSPIIPDRLIGGGQFLSDSTISLNFCSVIFIFILVFVHYTQKILICYKFFQKKKRN
jgi:hypothetical protein